MDDDETNQGETGEAGEDEGPENIIGEYEGERNANQERHGLGRAILPNRDYFEGNYRHGLRNGVGLYVFKNGARYNGQYHKGVKHGCGTFHYPNGTKYEGEWKNDLRHGYGAYYYENGDIYEGQWYEGQRQGLGCYTYKGLGVKFMGTWRLGKMEGPGQIISHAHRYHGVWKQNRPFGSGCFTFKTNCMQHGHHVHMNFKNFEAEEVFRNQLMPFPSDKEEEMNDIQAIWRCREISNYDPTRLPMGPVRFDYPPSEKSVSPPGTPMDDTQTFKYSFFDDIARYDKFYQDEKILSGLDNWGKEINKETGGKKYPGEEGGEHGG